MRIKWIEVIGFRGYRERIRFNLEGIKILLVYGPNGHGKTSFFDALEWALTGQISRYENNIAERNHSKFLNNLFAEERAEVKLCLYDDHENILIKRACQKKKGLTDYGHSDLTINYRGEVFEGETAQNTLRKLIVNLEWVDKVKIEKTLSLTHVLGQEQLNSLLRNNSSKERYNMVSSLIGTEQFYLFREQFTDSLKKIKNEMLEKSALVVEMKNRINHQNHLIEELKKKGVLTTSYNNISIQQKIKEASDVLNIPNEVISSSDTNLAQTFIHKLLMSSKQSRVKLDNELGTPLSFLNENYNQWVFNENEMSRLKIEKSRFERAKQLIEELNDIKYLQEMFYNYVKYTDLQEQTRLQERNAFQEAEEYVTKRERLYELATSLTKVINRIPDYEKFEVLIFYTLELISKIEIDNSTKFGLEADRQVRIITDLNRVCIIEERTLKESKGKINKLEMLLDEMKVRDQKYRQLLTMIQDFVVSKDDIETCPACGILKSPNEILNHIHIQQNDMDPSLPLLESELLEEKTKFEHQKRVLSNTEYRLRDAIQLLEEMVTEINAQVKYNNDMHSQALLKLEQVQIESKDLTISTRRFEETARKIGFHSYQVEMSTLQDKQKEIIQEYNSLLGQAAQDEYFNIDVVLSNIIRQMGERRNFSERYYHNLHQIGYDPLQTEDRYNTNNVTVHIEKQSKELSTTLKKLDDKESLASALLEELALFEKYAQMDVLKMEQEQDKETLNRWNHELLILQRHYEILDDLVKNVPNAIDLLSQKAIKGLFDTIQLIYEKINSHPKFDKIDFKSDQWWGSNNLMLQVSSGADNLNGNPNFIYSSAQINAVAISLFLAMALQQKWSPLNFIAMDDPIQSMDDLNVLALVDLIRVISDGRVSDKQIIISTHDSKFFDLMLKKFRYQKVGVVEFDGYSEWGPSTTNRDKESAVIRYEPKCDKKDKLYEKIFEKEENFIREETLKSDSRFPEEFRD
ncbi:AAA family ATPase [Paenibacillus prosopidis]|uniref:Nuclease SbcCD subunit C n=1 Tax=Paenibacillus prosopidis TaxID=630520 RepID=A0A368W9L5_9BACL|nr:AAA family ATPase [Paenibacillus prosopidis]RCW52063.1 DNA repair exonuclease SbcCD ATPase subunit [Paenibacillus prosopidis]